jgi:hypothetical protein
MRFYFLSFVFIYFSESGLFNGLQPIQIEKKSSAVKNPPWLQTATQRLRWGLVIQPRSLAKGEPVILAIISLDSALSNKMSLSSENLSAVAGPALNSLTA